MRGKSAIPVSRVASEFPNYTVRGDGGEADVQWRGTRLMKIHSLGGPRDPMRRVGCLRRWGSSLGPSWFVD
jgi:hypothetical protein